MSAQRLFRVTVVLSLSVAAVLAGRTPDPRCHPDLDGEVPDPFSCRNGLICRGGRVIASVPCPEGQLYNPNGGLYSCSPQEEVLCRGGDRDPTRLAGPPESYQQKRQRLLAGPVPNPVRTFTGPRRPANPSGLQPPTPTPSPWFQCPAQFGLYPDPYDCSKYFQCSYGFPFEETCQPGLEFNPLSLSCDWPANIHPPCVPQPYPTTLPPPGQQEDSEQQELEGLPRRLELDVSDELSEAPAVPRPRLRFNLYNAKKRAVKGG